MMSSNVAFMARSVRRCALFVTLLHLALAGQCRAAITLGTTASNGATSSPVSTTVTCSAGDFVLVETGSNGSTTTAMSLAGETLTLIATKTFLVTTIAVYGFTAASSHTGSTVTATISGSGTGYSILVLPFSSTTGVDAFGSGGANAAMQSVSVTSVSANDLAVGFEGSGSTSVGSAGSGYTLQAVYHANPTGGSASETGNSQSNSAGAGVTVAFGNTSSFPIIGILLAPTGGGAVRRRISQSQVL